MAFIGKRNILPVLREATPGFYLNGGALGEILLPGRYRTPDIVAGRNVEVFLYRDSEDRLVATTEFPHANVGEFAYLRVVGVDAGIGAFLDWNLDKDLLLPKREWAGTVRTGDWVVVHVSIDSRSNRIVASARLARHLDQTPATYTKEQPVRFLVIGETPLGYNTIVENAHTALLYHNDVTERLTVGQTLNGYVLRVRPDGKIDLTLHRSGYERIGPLTEQIMTRLADEGGSLPLHDKSDPAEILATLGVSKKAFKQAIGSLFREHRIVIEDHGIRLANLKPKPQPKSRL